MNSRKYSVYLKGSVLIVTMWIVLILAGLTIVFAQTTRVEAIAAANHISAVKAEAIAEGAISYIFSKLVSKESSTTSYGSNPYEAVHLGDGYFWVIKPNLADDKKYDYGLTDLGGRINLNSASLEILLKLPGMTAELAPSIIDWRDSDSEITQGGAEDEYYLLLSEPYYCKNAPLETVEETLMIKGGDWKSLYGEDLNRNGVLDKGEDENGNGKLDYGFFNYVTVHSYQANQNQNREKRINVNDVGNQGSLAEIIRQAVGENYYQVMNNIRFRHRFESLIDFYYATGMSYREFSKIIDKLTTTDGQRLVGLVNVNTAPSQVLLCLPGLEQSDVDSLVAKRESSGTDLANFLWVTQVLSREKAIQIGRYITASSSQYSADIVAVSGNGRAFRRYYVIIDMAEGSPKVVYKQSLHHLGWPLDSKILENLRDKNGFG